MSERFVIIAGATGFIGRAVCRLLIRSGYDIAVLTRDRERARRVFGDRALTIEWDGRTAMGWQELASRAEAVINLSGENIGGGRWTPDRRRRILDSRVQTGRAIVEGLRLASPRPRALLQASAVGFYGPRGDEEIDETSAAGTGFLAGVVRAWEDSTREAEDLGVRRVVLRSGLVLDKGGGALPRLALPFEFFVGGPLGSGRQWVSWIQRQDEAEAIRFLLRRADLTGAFNLTAPAPVRMKDLARALGRALKRPALFPVPSFLLKWMFGAMADETLLSGQRVVPRALLREGFRFACPDIDQALRWTFGKAAG